MDYENQSKGVEAPKLKLNIGRTIIIGLAFMSICLFWDIYDSYMPLFLANFPIFGEGDSGKLLTGVIMAMDNIVALVLLPFMGRFSDNYPKIFARHPKLLKLGKRMPFIVVGTLLSVLFLMLVTLGHEAQSLPLLLVATGFLLISISLYRSPAVALMPDVTPKPIRSKANAIINIMGVVGGLISMALSMFIKKTVEIEVNGENVQRLAYGINNWIIMGTVGFLMILAVVIMLIKVRENKFVEQKHEIMQELGIAEDDEDLSEKERKQLEAQEGGRLKKLGLTKAQFVSLILLLSAAFMWYMAYNGSKTFYSLFYTEYLNQDKFELPLIIGQAAGFISFIPASMIGSKIGRKKTVLLGILICALGFALGTVMVFTLDRNNPNNASLFNIIMIICFIFVGSGWATINVHSYVMSVEMATKHNTGAFTGLYYTFTMAAQVLTPILVGFLADVSFKLLFPYALLFMLLAFCLMLFVRHGNAKVVLPKDKLELLADNDD